MIVAAIVFIAFAAALGWSGVSGMDIRDELTSAFQGKVSGNGGSSSGTDPTASTTDSNTGVTTTASQGTGVTTGLVGRLVLLPSTVCAGGIPKYVDQAISGEVVNLCKQFHVKVSSGYRPGISTTHHNGGAVDFVGSDADMKALYNYALGANFAWIEPWEDATTVGVHGTTGAHVHISFVLPSGSTGGGA